MAVRYRIRFPLLAMGMLILLLAAGAGLVRLGWEVPLPNYDMLIGHGSLMVCGFLGTLIGLERAVALNRLWAYAAPFLTAVGGIWHIAHPADPAAPSVIALGSLGLVAIFLVFIRRHPDIFTACMGFGAVVWLVGNILWSSGWPLFTVVPWWMGFLLLTIAGERLELSRLLSFSRFSRTAFFLAIGAWLAGVCLIAVGFYTEREAQILFAEGGDIFTSGRFQLGTRLTGIAMVALCGWLLRYDIARRTLRHPGQPRFMAVCLLSGYGWLGVSGLLALLFGGVVVGLRYDAILHTFFLGFVFAMIFAHAPAIFPAILERPILFRKAFYAHLILLHLTLILRVTGDLTYWLPGRKWGGLLNALVLLLFLLNTVGAIRKPPRKTATAQV